MREVEAKLRVPDAAALRARLHALGARLPPEVTQTDVFFAHPQREFARTDEALRLREQEGLMELTYKGPRLPGAGAAKDRLELSVPVATDPTELLGALGFWPAAVLRKTRATTRVGACEVSLDHVDGLGDFVEVESLREDSARAAADVHSVLVRLALDAAEPVQQSYLELALAAGAAGARRLEP